MLINPYPDMGYLYHVRDQLRVHCFHKVFLKVYAFLRILIDHTGIHAHTDTHISVVKNV